MPEITDESRFMIINYRGRDTKVPENIVVKHLSNLCSYQGVIPNESKNAFGKLAQMFHTYKKDTEIL